MARYSSDQNKVWGISESGTYAAPMAGSAFWIGQVQSNSIDDKENKIETRYMGTSSRSVSTFDEGVRDVTGTISTRVTDMRMPFYAIGSVTSTSGTNTLHRATEIGTDVQQNPFVSGTGNLNPPLSFTLEDSKQAPGTGRNFIRTIQGCIPTAVTLTTSSSEVVTADIDYIGQTLAFTSGNTTSGAVLATKPYTFGNTALTVAGSSLTAKEVSFEINQNTEAPHYLNGSRDIAAPYQGNREYSLSITMDLDSSMAASLYNQYYKSTSTFNSVLDFDKDSATTGSQHAIFTFSGCHIVSMDNPSEVEGVTESTVEIKAENLSAVEYNKVASFLPY